MIKKWLALVTWVLASVVQLPAPVVKVHTGLVRGRLSENGEFYQYFGIPYGTVNERNRFQAPYPPPRWEGILEAINENNRCPQKMISSVVLGDPDCLKLNIYTPVKRKRKLFPVMVYIHGGCFLEGTGSGFLYGADHFAENGIVFVGISYRLNVEGFLCLGIKEAPGNAGLKDQLAALRWIKKNIAAFNGDPNNITLFGESAGAVSTSIMITSPAAKGLFHRAILQSGSSLTPWGIQPDPIKTASALAKEFGYYTKDPHQIYNILSKKSVNELINAIKYSKNRQYVTADTLFAPCIENKITDVEPIMTEHPADIIKSGNYNKVPMIIGFTDNEGIFFVAKNYGRNVKAINLADVFTSDLEFPSEADKNATTENLKKHYLINKGVTVRHLVDLYSDIHIKFPSVMESALHAKTNDQPMYFYLFKYSGYLNMAKMISMFLFFPGASHADELFYLFKPRSFPTPNKLLETTMSNRMILLWTNFAKYSDPTPRTSALIPVRWRPSREPNPTALIIDSHLTMAPMWDTSVLALWNETYNKYRRQYYRYKSFPQN